MLAVKHAQPSTHFPMDRPANDFFTCQYCADQFKREDHLRRHELSHRSPKFKCVHEGCGKSFHRNDVLKRHQLVHRPEPEKRKRSCRKRVAARGSTSRSPPVSTSSQSGYSPEPAPSVSKSPPTTTQLFPAPAPWIQIGPFLGSNDHPAMMNNFAISPWLTHNTYPELLDHSQHTPPSSVTDCTQMCVERAFQTTLSRLPFVHPSALDDPELPRELHLAIAAVGARDLDGNRGFGTDFFYEAEQLLQQANSSTQLRRLQCQVLLIDFATWSGNETLRQWAIKEQQVVAMAIKHLLLEPQSLLHSGWSKWLHAEELKRTLFAFYSLSISSAILLGTQIPLSSRHLGLAFPCSDSLWRARNEVEWARQLPLWEPDLELTLTFPNAVHTFLTGNIGFIQNDLTNLSLFSQHVVLCAIIEAIESSRRFPLNYSSIEGWISGSISTFSSRSHFLQILKLWNDFYQQPFEGSWAHGDHARPRIESVMLFKFVVDKLTNSDAPIDNPDVRFAAEQAADSLLCASKVGIMEIPSSISLSMSPSALSIATSLADSMNRWLHRLDTSTAGSILDPADAEIVAKIREAVANSVLSVSHPNFQPIMPGFDDLKALAARSVELWSIMLGNTQWVTELPSPAPSVI
ncbi:hypothetical protein Vi05172_g635 [Venturia inaequalis]|nr:hypothetical protein Vi05172_g635 [Venturia inaequalis]